MRIIELNQNVRTWNPKKPWQSIWITSSHTSVAQNHMGVGRGLLKHILLDYIPDVFIQYVWTGPWKYVFITNSPGCWWWWWLCNHTSKVINLVLSSFFKQNSIFGSILLKGPWELRKATYFLEIIKLITRYF